MKTIRDEQQNFTTPLTICNIPPSGNIDQSGIRLRSGHLKCFSASFYHISFRVEIERQKDKVIISDIVKVLMQEVSNLRIV